MSAQPPAEEGFKLGNTSAPLRPPPPGLADAMFAHAEELAQGGPPKTPAKAPEAPANQPDPAPAPSRAAADPTPKPKPDAPAAEKPKSGPAQLREALDKRDAELAEAKKKLVELQESGTATNRQLAEAHTKVSETETRFSKAVKRLEELEPLPARIQEMEKRLQEREERLRIADYTGTEEWHEKYIKPIAEAQQDARMLLSEMIVTDSDGNQRAATEADFNTVLSASSLNEAAKRARALFGDEVYQSVVNLRTRIASLQRSQREAVQTAALESTKYQERQQSAAVQERESTMRELHSKVDAFFEAEPTIFKPDEKDSDGITALTEGKKFADVLLTGDPSLPKDKIISKIAEGRARIIKSFVQDKRMAKIEAENKALKAELANYQRSEPGVETRVPGTGTVRSDDGDTKSRISAGLDDFLARQR